VALAVSVLMLTVLASVIPTSYQAFLTVVACIIINVLWTNATIKKNEAADSTEN